MINNIKSLREYCKINYTNLDLSDIKICISNEVSGYVYDITDYSRERLTELLTN
jgi:hypothetical protein